MSGSDWRVRVRLFPEVAKKVLGRPLVAEEPTVTVTPDGRGRGGAGEIVSRRSERSIRLNIAEGSGKHRPGGKAERYRTARGSANECAAGLDEVKQFDLAERQPTLTALRLVHRIIAMLTKLIIRWES